MCAALRTIRWMESDRLSIAAGERPADLVRQDADGKSLLPSLHSTYIYMAMPTKRTTRVSLGDVAREAGVSRMTVSLALRENGRLQASTAERVRAVAKRLGYMPNPRLSQIMNETARTRHSGQSGTPAFLMTEPVGHAPPRSYLFSDISREL